MTLLLAALHESGCVFSAAGHDDLTRARRPAAEKRKGTKSRREVVRRRCRRRAVPQNGYGDLAGRELNVRRLASAIRLEQRCNLNVPARMLLNGDFTFCPICDFNELSVAK